MKMSESIIELAKALSKFQGEVKQPVKDGTNPHFRSNYVTLQGTVEAITSAAAPNGLSFMQFPINDGERIGVYTLLMHSSGEWIESDPIFATPGKKDAQAVGSVITYMKRYSLSAAFGIASDLDDDGEASMNRGGQQNNYNQYPTQSNYNNQQNHNQSSQKSNSNLISEAQVKLVKAKLGKLGGTVEEKKVVYVNALKNLGFDTNIQTNELNKSQASKVIEYLTNLEG